MNIPFKLIKDALTEQRQMLEAVEDRIETLEDRLREKYEERDDLRRDILELEEFLRSHSET